MRKARTIIIIVVLMMALSIYSVAQAYQPVYGMEILKTNSFGMYTQSIAWDGNHLWYDANHNIVTSIDLETGNVIASFLLGI